MAEHRHISSRPKVYVTRRVPQKGVEIMLEGCNVSMWDSEECVPQGELLMGVIGVDGILCMPSDEIDAEVLDAAGPSLRAVATMSAVDDHIDVVECSRRGIQVLCSGQSTEGLADLTLALVQLTLSTATDAPLIKICEDHQDKRNSVCVKYLRNKTFGIYGLTKLGLSVARHLKDLGVPTILSANHLYNKVTVDSDIEIVSWPELLKRSDILCNCAQHDNNPPQIFTQAVFRQMKNSAIIVDCQNGNAVSYKDLYASLRDGDIVGAGINDCNQVPVPFRDPLRGLHNCVFLPQTKESTYDIRHKLSMAMAKNLRDSLCKVKADVISY